MEGVTDNKSLRTRVVGWEAGVGSESQRDGSPSSPLTGTRIVTIDNSGWLNNLKSFFLFHMVLPFLSAIIADGRACWCLGREEPSRWGEGF